MGIIEIDIVGTTETSVENMAKTGATGAAGEMAMGIFVSATTLGSLKVFAIRGIDMQNKGRPHQRAIIEGKKKGGGNLTR